MSRTKGFRTDPIPDNEVVELLENLLDSARRGYVRSVAIAAVNPVNLTEIAKAGDLGSIRSNALLGGLVRLTHDLIADAGDKVHRP